ncbi:hypothetical protein [Pseudomonas sp. RC10]|uniref:hypothetical protein n=1 Tax=Pseudomonas bambusae TaxID=3139142 RepID=UPI003138CB9A
MCIDATSLIASKLTPTKDCASAQTVMDIVASWRTGAGMELVEDIVGLTREVVNEYAQEMPEGFVLEAGED